MRSLSATSWLSRAHRDASAPSDPPPLAPSYITSRVPPLPPTATLSPQKSSFSPFHAVFRKQPTAPSIHSSYSASTSSSKNHPFSPMHTPPLPVVSNREPVEDEAECPVCLEPLSFSFRLPGEKPHIVPECGHALHEVRNEIKPLRSSPDRPQACFTAVYGPPPNQGRTTIPRKTNLGVCGVCRRPMKVGDGDGGKSNSLSRPHPICLLLPALIPPS